MEPPRRTLLVVDDSPTNLTLITAVLRERYTLAVATRGTRAVELARERLPDLILLDVEMPEMDGYEVCRILKADPATAPIPIIFLTARAEAEDEAAGFALGAADYIHKPFHPALVHARVGTQLRLADALRQAEAQRRRADDLLDTVLPPPVAAELRARGQVQPRSHPRAAVLFCDVVGFTAWCSARQPSEVISRLDRLFGAFDAIAAAHRVVKIKTSGDGYMGLVGALTPAEDPLGQALACAQAFVRAAPAAVPGWQVRAGVHVGPLITGVVGRDGHQFDAWGDTVNLAARLCAAARPSTVAVVPAPGEPEPAWIWRGVLPLKGKGDVELGLLGG